MEVFLHTISSFPTVAYTALMAVVLLYWCMVIFAGLDLDALGGSAEGLDGAVDAGTEGTFESASEGASGFDALHWLTQKRLPISVSASLVILAGWVASYVGSRVLLDPSAEGPAQVALAWAVGAGAFAVGWVVSSAAAPPLSPLFQTHAAEGNRDLVGKTCRVRTATVNESFGTAVVLDGASGDVIQVRYRGEAGALQRGSEALIVSYDPDDNTFLVEPMARLTASAQAAALEQ